MGDQRLPGNQLRRKILKPTPQDMTCKSRNKDQLPSKCFLRQKKEQVQFPTSLEGQHRLFGKESLEEFKRGSTPREGAISRGPEGALFPTISHRVPSSINSKSQRKLLEDTRVFLPVSPLQHVRRSFWEDIGNRQAQNLLSPWPRGEETSADLLIKWLEEQKPDLKQEGNWPFWDSRIEAIKQALKSGKPPPGTPPDSESPDSLWPCEGRCFYESKHRPQDMLSTIYYKYIYKAGDEMYDWSKPGGLSITQQSDMGCEGQSNSEDSPVKKTSPLPSDIKPCPRCTMGTAKDLRLAKLEASLKSKYKMPPDPHNTNKDKIKHATCYFKPNQLKKTRIEEPLTDPKVLLEGQGKSTSKPDILEDHHEPSDFKDNFSSQDDSVPGVLEKLFMRKGWDYGYVTPPPKIIKAREWFLYQNFEEEEDDEEYN